MAFREEYMEIPLAEFYNVTITFTNGEKFVHKSTAVNHYGDHIELIDEKEKIYIPVSSILFIREVRLPVKEDDRSGIT